MPRYPHLCLGVLVFVACSAELDRSPPLGTPADAQVPNTDAGDFGPGFEPGSKCDIQALMARADNGCTNAGCHGAQFQGGLDLLSAGVAKRLTSVASKTEACGGELLIDAKDVERSLLLRVIDPARFAAAPCGVMMPFGSAEGVSADTRSCFEAWVRELATNGSDADGGVVPVFEPAAPASYVNKVKTLLTGRAATIEEIHAGAAPNALRQLASTWVGSADFARKLADFLRVALQQQLEGSLDTQFMRLRGNKLPALRANLQESFVRTAAAIVAEGRAFTDILTTRRWQVTTATLAALSFLERTPAALRAEKHTLIAGAGSSSVLERKWYIPTLPADCNAGTVGSDAMLEVMLGFVQCKGVAKNHRFDDTLLSDADFADWHSAELVEGADTPLFYDVAALRGRMQIPLTQRRLGFFTTPAFLANWETNEDNQFRVTTSQTMIVALGELFSPADPTQTVRLDGLARDHADPKSTCFGCHQFLDPMREYFAQSFSFSYQGTSTPTKISPSFAFRGQQLDGGDLSDFANTLAAHPLFASAWTQKLCYWANSQPCSESDPEFQRVARSFVDSGFDFKALVVELMSSPLVTAASATRTYELADPFLSVTRRQHLCQLLDVRLGVSNACDVAASFAGLVPEDGFNRGSAAPVQASVTGLFHYAAAEKLCLRLATRLVGAGAAARFPVRDPQAALDVLVSDLMGLGEGHPRRADVRARLGAHYEDAKAMTDAATALRSAFTVACVSPEVMAVGL